VIELLASRRADAAAKNLTIVWGRETGVLVLVRQALSFPLSLLFTFFNLSNFSLSLPQPTLDPRLHRIYQRNFCDQGSLRCRIF
jgi:hypothetical protein